MQTFLPLPDLHESVKCLDPKRLNKQGTEAKQILDTLLERPTKTGAPRKGWTNHPAVLMWRGYEAALAVYHNLCLEEHEARGGKNPNRVPEPVPEDYELPWWLGDNEFHASHRSQLLAKACTKAEEQNDWTDYDWYGSFLWTEIPGRIPYKWPVTARLEDLKLVPLSKQPNDLGCSEISANLSPVWDTNTGLLNFGLTTLRCFRAWESRDELMAPDGAIDVTRNDHGVWCWVLKTV